MITMIRRALVTGFLKCLLAVVLLCSGPVKAVELMPETVFFDPPTSLLDKGNGNDPLLLRSYEARDNVPGKTYRGLSLSLRAVGHTNAPAGQSHYIHMDQQALGRELLARYTSYTTNGSGICRLSGVTNSILGGLPAVQLSFQVELPYQPYTSYCEIYSALFESNRVVEVTLSANSREGLPSLRGCLSGIRIRKRQ